MAKFNRKGAQVAAPSRGTITTARKDGKAVETRTFNGAIGYSRTAKSDLFLMAASSLAVENTYYEKGTERLARFTKLVQQVVAEDPQWLGQFLGWLRGEGNIRTAALIGGIEAAVAMVQAGVPGGRQVVASVLQRPDEPGEAIGYWLSTRGRATMPKALKRGIADAARRLYNEYGTLKYDTDRFAVRFADVLNLTHPEPVSPDQGDLFQFIMDRRHGHVPDREIPGSLQMVTAQQALRAQFAENPSVLMDTERLRKAGMTWEDTLSLAGQNVSKAALWRAMLPSLGYMALLRNLRNLDEACLPDRDVQEAIARLQDEGQVAKSRQFPYRFYSAYKQLSSVRWALALERALNLATRNIPEFPGRTVILIDTSGSMQSGVSAKSKFSYGEAAAVFAMAVAARSNAEVFGFADGLFHFPIKPGSSVLKNIGAFIRLTGSVGHGTETAMAIRNVWAHQKYDRMFVFSDGQTSGHVSDQIMPPAHVPCYFYNLAGYAPATIETKGQRFELGGLTDASFRQIPMLEQGRSGKWPWEA